MIDIPSPRVAVALIGLALVSCKAATKDLPRPSELLERWAEFIPAQEHNRPVPEKLEGWDWIKLTSGEWLKGEVKTYNKETLDFESDELGDLNLDWDKVEEIVSENLFTIRLTDRSTRTGILRIQGDEFDLITSDGNKEKHARSEIQRFIRGEPTEQNYWSGHVRAGLVVRRGNTDQVDNTLNLGVSRKTAISRYNLAIDSIISNVSGVENANNQTLTSNFDLYMTPRFFATPLGFELFRDRIQNIGLRATPYAGLGYTLLDRSNQEFDVKAGIGYRYQEFDSVAAGQSSTTDTATILAGTDYHQDLTDDIELDIQYGAQIGLEDLNATNQNFSFLLTFEFVYDLDFTVNFVWKRVGQPEADDAGNVPSKDDVRFDVGLSWSF